MVLRIDFDKWEDSQKNERNFWNWQFGEGNQDQFHRNVYYRSLMEGVCSIIKDFLDSQSLDDKTLLDVGSGPEGLLHKLKAKEKYALDPLMDEYGKMGYGISDNDVIPISGSAEEELSDYINKFDIIFCLNALDHMCDIEEAIRNIRSALVDNGFLVLMTDVRTERQLDSCHKIFLSVSEILTLLKDNDFSVHEQMKFNHGAGNPVMQWCGICQK